LSNRSLWLSFTTLSCRRWAHENVVLLGDAAHTAHFSIGSGTKLALEDSIALAQAFEQHDAIPDALRTFEQGRRPRVEATQRAAAESRRYFENIRRYRHFEPIQFAFHLLTRSGRITWDNLRGRDPYFVADVERWFQATAAPREREAPLLVAPPAMFAPLRLRELTLPNRVVMQPVSTYSAMAGAPGPSHGAQLGRRALSGAGLVLTEPVAISAEGRVTPGDPGLYADQQAERWREIVEMLHADSCAKVGITLAHAGRRGATRPRGSGIDRPLRDGAWSLLAPSAIPYGPGSQTPRAMTRDDMDLVRGQYVLAARLATGAGFDLLQLDMAHGGLLASFLSPLTNQREDDEGGDLRHRLRYPLAIVDGVRAAWPAERPLLVTIPASDWQRGG
ncbi:MAG: FAD-dependent monooxygenase, partial [Vicinamibacterales bacterium]